MYSAAKKSILNNITLQEVHDEDSLECSSIDRSHIEMPCPKLLTERMSYLLTTAR